MQNIQNQVQNSKIVIGYNTLTAQIEGHKSG